MLVWISVTVMWEVGTAAPEESLTTPRNTARSVCANNDVAANRQTKSPTNGRNILASLVPVGGSISLLVWRIKFSCVTSMGAPRNALRQQIEELEEKQRQLARTPAD